MIPKCNRCRVEMVPSRHGLVPLWVCLACKREIPDER